jgi:predicted SAM-dependent methyltransferase
MIGFSKQRLFSRGVWRAFRVLKYEWKLQKIHRAGVRNARQYAGQKNVSLNLGCGDHPKKGWVNVDSLAKADLQLDLREDFPFAPQSVGHIYCEHFFEHLEFPKQAKRFLRECARVLVAGGKLDIGVPDTEWPVKAYSDDKEGYFSLAKRVFHPKWCRTKMDHLNFHFRQGEEHKYAYDEETLTKLLTEAGFVSVKRRLYDPSLDSVSRQPGTLYVVGWKPSPELRGRVPAEKE